MSSVPEPHAAFLRTALARLAEDSRLVGVAAAGSYLTQTMDEWSDLDLVIAVEPADYASVLEDRPKSPAASAGCWPRSRANTSARPGS